MTDAHDKSALPLFRKLQSVFSHDLFAELEYVQLENRILRSKFGHRVPLTDADRRILVRYGMRIKHHLDDLATIVRPETILRWHRRMKQQVYERLPDDFKQAEMEKIKLNIGNGNGHERQKEVASGVA